MLARFSITPLGTGVHRGDPVAEAVRIVDESGLEYQVTAMDTLVEGEWEEVMSVIRRCVEAVQEQSDRVACDVRIEAWKGHADQLSRNVVRVEERLEQEVTT